MISRLVDVAVLRYDAKARQVLAMVMGLLVVSCAQSEPARPKADPAPSAPLAITRRTSVPAPAQPVPVVQSATVATQTNEAPLQQLKARYEAKLRELDRTRDKSLADAPAQYRLYLQNLEKQFVDKGDLKGVLAVQTESNRFAKAGAVTTNDLVSSPEALLGAQKLLIGAPESVERTRLKGRDDLNRAYLAALELLKIDLTKRKRIPEAVDVSTEIERIRPLVPPGPPATAEILPVPSPVVIPPPVVDRTDPKPVAPVQPVKLTASAELDRIWAEYQVKLSEAMALPKEKYLDELGRIERTAVRSTDPNAIAAIRRECEAPGVDSQVFATPGKSASADMSALRRLRDDFERKRTEAMKEPQDWCVKELQRVELQFSQANDPVSAKTIATERDFMARPPLEIVRATWGSTDITPTFRNGIRFNHLEMRVNRFIANGAAGRSAFITYRIGGGADKVIEIGGGTTMRLP